MKKRIFSLLLLVAMLVTAVPVMQASAVEEVEETPKSESVEYVDLNTLYVKEGLVSLFTAFGDNTGIDLTKGTWTDRLNGNVATFKAPHRWFRTGENGVSGGVAFDAWSGYMKTVDGVATYTKGNSGVAFPTENYLINANTSANEARLEFGKENLPAGDFTVEYLALYRPVLIVDADKSTESKVVYYEKDGALLSAYDHGQDGAISAATGAGVRAGDAFGHFYSFRYYIDGSASWGSNKRGSLVWLVGHRWWADGSNYKFVGKNWGNNASTQYALSQGHNGGEAFHTAGKNLFNTYGVFVDEEKDGESGVKALLGLYRDGVAFADSNWYNSSENKPSKNPDNSVEYGASYPLAGTSWVMDKNFWISSNTPTEFYSVRIYDRVLGEDERMRNHVIDVLLYYGIGLTLEQTRDVVFMQRLGVALEGVSLETNVAAKEATKAMIATCVGGLEHVIRYAANEDMTSLFTVYEEGTVDLENGVWRNLLPNGNATFGQKQHWKTRDNGSVGFSMYWGTVINGVYEPSQVYETNAEGKKVLVGYKNTNWNDFGLRLDLGIDLLPADDFTLEYLIQYHPYYVTDGQDNLVYGEDGKPIETYTAATAAGYPMPTDDPRDLHEGTIRIGYLNAHTYTFDGEWGGVGSKRHSGSQWGISAKNDWDWNGGVAFNPMKGSDYFIMQEGIRTYSITRSEAGASNVHLATYQFLKDGDVFYTKEFDGTKNTAAPVDFSIPEYELTGSEDSRYFWLSERYATDFYTIRIYNRVLNEDERKHNIAVDVMNYYGITLSTDVTENDELYEKVKAVLVNADLVENALAKEAEKTNLLAEIKSAVEDYELINQYASPENLTSLFTVHKKDSLNLAKGTWTDIITGKNATFGTFWEQRENGAFGFDAWAGYMTTVDGKATYTAGKADVAFPTTNYIDKNDPTAGYGLTFGISLLPTEDFTVEYMALYRPVLVIDASKSSATEAVYYEENGKLLAAYDIGGDASIPDVVTWACDAFGWFSTRTMNTDGGTGWGGSPRGSVAWMVGHFRWGWGSNFKFVGGCDGTNPNNHTHGMQPANSLVKSYHKAGVNSFFTYSVSVDETVTDTGATEANLRAYRNSAKLFDNAGYINSTANTPCSGDNRGDSYVDYGRMYKADFTGSIQNGSAGAAFYLSSGTPTDFMVVRIYDKALAEEEQKHNLVVDVLNYYSLTLPLAVKSDAALYAEALSLIVNTPIVSSNLERSVVAAELKAGLLKIAGVSLKADNDYAALYVTKGENATLLGLFTAFEGDYSANLATGVWENRAEGSTYGDATLNAEWTRYEKGIGYRIVPVGGKTAKALIQAHGGVSLDNDFENLTNFTVETFAKAYGATDAHGNRISSGSYVAGVGNFRFGMLNCFAWASVGGSLRNRWAVSNVAYPDAWTVTQAYSQNGTSVYWADEMNWYNVGKDVPTAALMTATRVTGDDDSVAYKVTYNNAATAAISMNIDAEEYARVASYTSGGGNFEKDRRFSLFNTVAATIYSIRVYDGPLTAAEKAQNRLADLLYYHDVDLPDGFVENEEAINAVISAVGSITISEVAATKAQNKTKLENAIASVSKQVTIMDATDTVITSKLVITGDDYILPEKIAEKQAIAWYVNGDAKAPGSVVAMTEDITVKPVIIDAPTTAHTVSLKTTARADDLAMRFTATIARADFEAIAEIYGIENLRIGMLITPVAYVEHANGVFTREALRQMVLDKTHDPSSPAFVDVEAGSFYAKTDTTLTIAGSIYRFSDVTKAKNPPFTAIAYIDVVTDDVSFTVYGSYDASVQFRVKDTMLATRPYMTDQQRKWINALLELFA